MESAVLLMEAYPSLAILLAGLVSDFSSVAAVEQERLLHKMQILLDKDVDKRYVQQRVLFEDAVHPTAEQHLLLNHKVKEMNPAERMKRRTATNVSYNTITSN